MMLCLRTEELIRYGVKTGLLQRLDISMARNLLYQKFGITAAIDESAAELIDETEAMIESGEVASTIDDLIAWFDGLFLELDAPPRLAYEQDIYIADVMNLLMQRNHEMNRSFWDRYASSPRDATDFFYQAAIDSGYIRMDRIALNRVWSSPSRFGSLDITINRSKPEKSPEEIALMKTMKSSVYPKCMLCKENIGYEGSVSYPPRQNLRYIEIVLGGEPWYFQYSPYVYYNEHAIAFSAEHRPMVIDRSCLVRLLDFVDIFPHYFVGSNADLPIVGGSILTHDHYQAGNYEMPMFRAGSRASYDTGSVRVDELDWPLTVLSVSSTDRASVIETAERIRSAWTDYGDPDADLFARTFSAASACAPAPQSGAQPPSPSSVDGERHNTVTPIARYDADTGRYILYLALRNNRTSEQYPLGIFHPHPEYHHIKRENIGLIEVMGLAVLPGRLVPEMEELAAAYAARETISDENPHKEWADELMRSFHGTPIVREILAHLYAGIGATYGELLCDSGIFKHEATAAPGTGAAGALSAPSAPRGVERFLFTVFGTDIQRIYTLRAGEAAVTVSSLGAAMHSFAIAGREKLLGYDDIAAYRTNLSNANIILAPNAGRVKDARLGDMKLESNEGANNLHSGSANTGLWQWHEIASSPDRLLLGLHHPDGRGGFRGDLALTAEWTLSDGELTLAVRGEGAPGTHLNATNHNYYAVDPNDLVSVAADHMMLPGDGNIPGTVVSVDDPVGFDLRSPRPYRAILAETGGIDHVYLREQPGTCCEDGTSSTDRSALYSDQPAAVIASSTDRLSFYSDQPAVVVYTANHDFCHHRGICFEFQQIPNREHRIDGGYANIMTMRWERNEATAHENRPQGQGGHNER